MSADPTKYLRRRFGAAIDWRVRDAVEAKLATTSTAIAQATQGASDRDQQQMAQTIAELGRTIADVSITLSDQQRALGELLDQFDRRLAALEGARARRPS